MLIVSRAKGESLVIGGVTITIIEVREDEVRFSIEHPPEAWGRRQEACEGVEREEVLVPRPR